MGNSISQQVNQYNSYTGGNNDNKNFILYNRPYTFFKPNYNSIIPLKIFQTWFTKDLPPKMKTRVEILKRQNPRFEHFLFDDNDKDQLALLLYQIINSQSLREELSINKTITKITNMIGEECLPEPNKLLIYHYSDDTRVKIFKQQEQ